MIDVSGFSRELCGGTHVSATGEIGVMKIIAESSVGASIRRIEAVTGIEASKHFEALENNLTTLAQMLKTSPAQLTARVQKLIDDHSHLEKELKKARQQGGGSIPENAARALKEIAGVRVLAQKVSAPDRETLAAWTERLRDQFAPAVIALMSAIDQKVAISVCVSKPLIPSLHAGKIVQLLSEAVGGKGGGRPDFAQGGGTDLSKMDEALEKIDSIIEHRSS